MYDKKNLAKLKQMDALAPEVMEAFWAFDRAAMGAGDIPAKYKELISVPYCIDTHSTNARKQGATDAQIVEAVMVSAALPAGGSVTHSTHAIKGE